VLFKVRREGFSQVAYLKWLGLSQQGLPAGWALFISAKDMAISGAPRDGIKGAIGLLQAERK